MEAKGYNCSKCGKSVFQKDINEEKGGIVNEVVYCEQHYKEFIKQAVMKTRIIGEEEKTEGRDIS